MRKICVWRSIFGVLLCLAFLAACDEAPEKTGEQTGYAALTQAQQEAVDHFLATHSGLGADGDKDKLILCRMADLNYDGIDDVVVLYAPAKGTQPVEGHSGNAMCVLVSREGGFTATNSLPAPHERQSIQFRDIDGKPPLEFVVSGYKGARTGLGVYRVYGETVENLFGESMDECC